MKKLLSWMLVIALIISTVAVFSITGCKTLETMETASAVEETTSAVEETASEVKETTSEVEKAEVLPAKEDKSHYNWSTMQEGPYNDKISFAASSDLLNWTDQKTVLAEHASVPDVIIKDGTLYVYFVDVTTDGIKEQIGLVTSNDKGKTWSEREIVTINELGDKAAVDPAPYLLPDGTIRLYYLDLNATRSTKGANHLANNTIYYADSVDGKTFTEKGAAFKHSAVFDPTVIKVGDIWRMYAGTDIQQVLSATSTDGISFTYEGVALDKAGMPNVIFENDQYYLFTGGIEIANSKDGKTFTKLPNHFNTGKLTADPGVVKLGDGSYLMVYKTSDKIKKK